MRCSPLFIKYRVVNTAIGIRNRWRDRATVTVSIMSGGNYIYLVGPLIMPHIKTTNNFKKRSSLLRICFHSLCQYWYLYRKTMKRSMRYSPLFPWDRLGNAAVGGYTMGRSQATAMVPTIDVHGFEFTGL